MEFNEHYLLDEIEGLRREINWELAIPTEMNELISDSNGWNFDFSDHQNFGFDQFCLPADQFTAASNGGDSLSYNNTPSSFEYAITSMEEEELGILEDEIHNLEVLADFKIEPVFNSADFGKRIGGGGLASRKIQGQPSKNLMAERRRRKRLNDRLSMLRSIVPKISKMDRTAIVADAIEYVKELVEKINNLEREIQMENSMVIMRDVKPHEYLVRNSPKFNVEKREEKIGIEICCAAKPGLLLSTIQTLEELGLDIDQCVISCFNDFSIQASCTHHQEMEQRRIVGTEEVKQALFETAGYGGRCPS